jgi:hypothetical protein
MTSRILLACALLAMSAYPTPTLAQPNKPRPEGAIELIPREASEPTGNVRIFTLEHGHASVLAEAVAELFPKMRANPVRVIQPAQGEKPAKAPAKLPGQGPATKPVPADSKPVTLTAVGNRLIAVSEDPEALALVKEFVQLLTASAIGEGDFEVIRMRNANAVAVAKVLEELFNGRASAGAPGWAKWRRAPTGCASWRTRSPIRCWSRPPRSI